MRTVSTLCASGAGIGIGTVGLAVVREDSTSQPQQQPQHQRPPRSRSSAHIDEMTAVAPYPQQLDLTSSFPFSTPPPPARSVSEGQNGKARSGEARVGQKRSLSRSSRAATAMDRSAMPASTPTPPSDVGVAAGTERTGTRDGDDADSLAGTPTAHPHSWLRRLSSSMSTSRDSSQTSQSRPGSAAISYSARSMAFSQSGSTTPIFRDNRTPPPLQPNKLVKRTASLRSTNGSPLTSSGSRLPMPVFRRPATSHQRSATMQDHLQGERQRMGEETATPTRDSQFRQYFTPKVAVEENFSRRRSATSIPNPVKRVYPDRRYTPILVSARNAITPARTELDDNSSADDENEEVTKLALAPSVASSPLPAVQSQFSGSQPPKRSFSIGDMLSTGPQPLWRKPSQRQSRAASTKLVRKGMPRVASAPQSAMGNSSSRNAGRDSEPPAKRRDLTDPLLGRRSIYSSSSGNPPLDFEANHEVDLHLSSRTPQSSDFDGYGTPTTEVPGAAFTSSPLEQHRLPSADLASATRRPTRVSAAQSEITSTIGSDSDFHSIGDASTDYQSDAVYDSYPTRTTRSSSGRRGPHIESIFDDSPPTYSSGGRSTRLKDLLSDGTYTGGEPSSRYRHSTIEEEGSIVSTPVRSLHNQSIASTPSARPGAQQLFGSSPPVMPIRTDPDEIDWDAFDEDREDQGLGFEQPSLSSRAAERVLPFRFGPALQASNHASTSATPNRSNGDKANLFEWAEVQPSPSHNQSPPRPRTVHGKKDPENRGSRAPGRRAPSGMHARSHSVPVVPDTDGKRSSAVANKFGTWGVGSKAVTEDWNEDFDFEEAPPVSSVDTIKQDEKRIDSGHEMFVPRSIREQQENVVANIGLLREWGLLIEELKELRVRAVALDMLKGPYSQAWYEVDAMIELADQETEEQTLEPRRSPPSSPGFDYGEFDEPMPNIESTARPFAPLEASVPENEVAEPSQTSQPPATPQQQPITTRPRKDSEAVARSVIEALQTRRAVSDPTALKVAPPSKKVPFDTATLRHIVPYVNGLKRKVKDALRETEGLYSSPRRRVSPNSEIPQQGNQEPAFRSIFNEPDPNTSPALRRSRREQAATDHDGSDDQWLENSSDLTTRLRNMKLPQ